MKRTSLVIPVADEPHNDTLPLVLETMARHAPWLDPVLIGGGLHLEHYIQDFSRGVVLRFNQAKYNDPVSNTTRMLALALDDSMVTDPFVWSNDDIYFRQPVELDDIREAGATGRGRLTQAIKNGRYGSLAHRTAALLQAPQVNRPIYDYERHVPLVINKVEMRRALDLIPPRVTANPRSLYQNLLLDEPAAIAPDVKLFVPTDQVAPSGPFFSTGNNFPVSEIRRILDLN